MILSLETLPGLTCLLALASMLSRTWSKPSAFSLLRLLSLVLVLIRASSIWYLKWPSSAVCCISSWIFFFNEVERLPIGRRRRLRSGFERALFIYPRLALRDCSKFAPSLGPSSSIKWVFEATPVTVRVIEPRGVTLENGLGEVYLPRFSISRAIRFKKPTFYPKFDY